MSREGGIRRHRAAAPLHVEPELGAVAEHAGQDQSRRGRHVPAVAAQFVDMLALNTLATRVKVCQERSAAVVAALFDVWDRALPHLSRKSKLAEAIRYATSRRAALERFLSDGRIEIDSNTVERAIRPQHSSQPWRRP